MSSAETLTFGPQWLRELSGGADKSNTNPPIPLPPSRFKLAKYRYGREEMLALFLDEEVIPEDLYRVPYVVVEAGQRPLALTPMNDNFQPNVSDGRGMTVNSFHEHSVVGRGRGRGNLRNGDMFVGVKEPLRRPDKKDWRSISEQPGGKGDGQDDIFGDIQDWRSNSNRNDMTRGLQDPWYDRNTDVRNKKQIRNRSLSAKDKSTPMFLPWPNEPLSPELNQESPQNTSKVKEDCEEGEGDFIPPNEKIEILVEKEKSVEVEQIAMTGLTEVLAKEEPTKTVSFPVHTSDPQAITTVINNEEVVQVSSHLILDLPKEDTHDNFLRESHPISVTSGANLVQPNPPQLIPQVNPITHLQILATTWFYKDPQGKIQGPFNSGQMMEWFKAGYFARELLVKRACDVDFIQLGNLIESCGYVPFKQYEIGPTHVRTEEYHSDIARQTFVDQQRLLQEQHLLRQQGHLRWPQQEHSIAHQNFAEITRNNDQWNKEQFLDRMPQHTPSLHQNSLEYGNVTNYEQYNHTVDSSKELSMVEHLEDMVADVVQVHTQSENLISLSVEPQKIQNNLRTPEATVPQHSPEHEVFESKGMQFIEMTSQEIGNEVEPEKPALIDIVVEQKSKIDVEQEKSPQKELEQQSKFREKSTKKDKDGKTTKQESKKKREELKQQKNSKENKQKNQEKQAVEQKKKTIKENTDRKKEVESNEDTKNKVKLPKGWNQQREIAPIAVVKEKSVVPAPPEYIEAPYNAIPENVNREKPKPRQEPIPASLPPTVYWAQNQTTEEKQHCLSLFEIQQMEEKTEQIQREQMRKLQVTKQQEKTQQVGWAQKVTEKPSPKSFWEIQREEQMRNQAAHQPSRNQVKNVEKNHATIVAAKKSASFWDQVVEENKPAPKPTPSRAVQKVEKPRQTAIQGQTRTTKKTNEEKQTQRMPRDIVIEHCENYLRRINAEHIDIPTFVNFLYDVESPDEVREYVTSYLGENGGAKEFSKIFLDMRSKQCSLSKESSIIQISCENPRAPAPMDDYDDGFKLVKVNTKNSKNKRRQRKLQKADPSLLGFSVNAASDRVNMGEIETTNNH